MLYWLGFTGWSYLRVAAYNVILTTQYFIQKPLLNGL